MRLREEEKGEALRLIKEVWSFRTPVSTDTGATQIALDSCRKKCIFDSDQALSELKKQKRGLVSPNQFRC